MEVGSLVLRLRLRFSAIVRGPGSANSQILRRSSRGRLEKGVNVAMGEDFLVL